MSDERELLRELAIEKDVVFQLRWVLAVMCGRDKAEEIEKAAREKARTGGNG